MNEEFREMIKSIVYQREWFCELQRETRNKEDYRKYEHKLEAINDCLKTLGYNPNREEYSAILKEMREEEHPTISDCMGQSSD